VSPETYLPKELRVVTMQIWCQWHLEDRRQMGRGLQLIKKPSRKNYYDLPNFRVSHQTWPKTTKLGRIQLKTGTMLINIKVMSTDIKTDFRERIINRVMATARRKDFSNRTIHRKILIIIRNFRQETTPEKVLRETTPGKVSSETTSQKVLAIIDFKDTMHKT